MEKILEIANLTKTYGKNRGVTDVSFTVERGDIFGFLGPNGAGKSTTIRSMLGMIRPDSGSIRIFGKDSRKEREEILKDIGYMPSEAVFYDSMTVREVIRFAADMRGMDCSKEAEKLCERLRMEPGKKIRELSLGNRKKVSIVCAMQHRPALFVFDEPTSGLDPLMQAVFFELIEEYVAEGATCLLSTHVLSEAKNHCRHLGIMKEGRLIAGGETEKLTHTNAKRVRGTVDGEKKDYLYSGSTNGLIRELAGKDVRDIVIEEPTLDEIFMEYYRES